MMREPLKKRLVGGLVIAAVGALALSFVLHDSHPTYREEMQSAPAAKPTADHTNQPNKADNSLTPVVHTRWLPLPQHPVAHTTFPHTAAGGTCQYHPDTSDSSCSGADAKPEPAPLPVKPVPVPPKPVLVSKAVAPTGKWVLRLASFKQKSNAMHLVDDLKRQAIPASVSRFSRLGSFYYRVSVGPSDRTTLTKWQHKLAKSRQLRGYIVKK